MSVFKLNMDSARKRAMPARKGRRKAYKAPSLRDIKNLVAGKTVRKYQPFREFFSGYGEE